MLHGIFPEDIILALSQSQIQNMLGLMSLDLQKAGECCRQLCVDQEPHTVGSLSRLEDGVINLRGGKLQTGPDVLGLEERIIGEYFLLSCTGAE